MAIVFNPLTGEFDFVGTPSGSSGIASINTDTTTAQTLTTGTSGTDFAIVDNGIGDHKFNLPVASATDTGKLSNTDWSTFNNKVPTTRTISTTAPLAGGGDFSANRTLTTSMATNKLIGRGTAGTGVMEEITLGTGLSLTGTTLNATGSVATWYQGEAVSGTVDGVNVTFTLAHTPTSVLFLYMANQPQIFGVDYTLSGATITFNVPPDASLSGTLYATYL